MHQPDAKNFMFYCVRYVVKKAFTLFYFGHCSSFINLQSDEERWVLEIGFSSVVLEQTPTWEGGSAIGMKKKKSSTEGC